MADFGGSLSFDAGLMAGGRMVAARGRGVSSFASLPQLCRVVCGLLFYALQTCEHRLSITEMGDSGVTFISLMAVSDQASPQSAMSILSVLSAFCGMRVSTILFPPSECWNSLVRSLSFCVSVETRSTSDPGLVLPVPNFIRDFVPGVNCVMVPMVPSLTAGSSASLSLQTVVTQAVATPLIAVAEGVSALPVRSVASGVASSAPVMPASSVAPSGSGTTTLIPVSVSDASILPASQLYSPISSATMPSSESDPDSDSSSDSNSDSNSDSSLSLPASISPIASPRRSSTPISVATTEVYGEGDSIPGTPSPLMSPRTMGTLSELVLILPIPASNAARLLSEEARTVSPDPVLGSAQALSPSFGSDSAANDPLIGPSVMDDIPGLDLSLDSLLPLLDAAGSLPDVAGIDEFQL